MAKNPPPTGEAQSVTNEHVRAIIKGRSEPGAPAQRERKNFRRTQPRAATEEPSAASKSDGPNADEAGERDEV
jgi:hypothetical protein